MAAIIDTHEDVGRVEQSFYHWGARGLKKLEQETLRSSGKKCLLTVNKNTRSATLPPDFDYETFVGVLDDNGKKIPLKLNPRIADLKNIEDIPCEDRCPKCNQDKSICEDITITEETSIVEVNGNSAQMTVIKKLYPDGKYYLETITPVWDYESEVVIYHSTKEFITELDLKPCGCIDETEENIQKIRTCCPEAWACHFAVCDNTCNKNYGGYRIFEDTGIIYFDDVRNFSKVYIEYQGFLPKINGQYHIPKVCFETLVEWVTYKYIQHKNNVSESRKERQFESFRRERGNMEIILGRIHLSQILSAILKVPKFDWEIDYTEFCNINVGESLTDNVTEVTAAANSCNEDKKDSSCCPVTGNGIGLQPFQIAVIAGIGDGPTPGLNSYTLPVLRNALDLNIIFVNNTAENTKNQQVTFDPVSGTIFRWQGDNTTPNYWVAGDTLIANFNKKVTVGGFISNPVESQRPPIFVKVGTTAGAPTAGVSIWQNSNFANAYITLFKNGTPVALSDPGTGDAYITKPVASDTLTITNYSWQDGDELLAIITTPQ